MKKLCILLVAGLLLLSACSPAAPATPAATQAPAATDTPLPPPTATPTPAPSATPTEVPPSPTPEAVVLELEGPTGSKSLTLSDLKALPTTQGQAGTKSSTGRITPPLIFTGVTLADLAAQVGGLDPSLGIDVVAKDGYIMTLSYDQVTKGEFIAYDPATGDERKMEEPLTVIVAYERDGQPISDEEGPLRLAILSPKNNQVTDGHWSVKWVTQIRLKPLGEEWGLEMHGAIDDTMDRNTFQSCTAPGCHQASWTDDKGQKWSGTPLYYFAGRVDDTIKHDGPAFFDLLASLGYQVQVVSSDGYSVTLEIGKLAHNDDILLANLVDEAALPEKYFPLRLVGEGLEKGEMVGQVAKINLIIDPATLEKANSLMPPPTPTAVPTPEPTQPPAAVEGDLVISGLVAQPQGFTEADLRAMPAVKLEAEHPKKGKQSYEGVRLNDLLALAKPQEGAKTLVITAGDGYSAEAPLADVLACTDCLLAFTDTPGSFFLVMPGMESSLWVKDVASLEIK